jgi:Major Facilitator Superfamily.
MTLLGAFIGGVMVVRHGIIRPLVLGAVLIATTNLLFSFLAVTEPDLQWLAIVVSMDNLSGGLATAVFIAYLSSLTSSAHTATQYALFSSLMTLPAKFISGFSGVIVDSYGYYHFFLFAAGLGLPAIILAVIVFWRSKAVL